jgi:hypothetical protein
MSKQAIFGGATTGIAPFSDGETNAGMADRGPSVSDVHFQLWMLLVTGIILFWFLYVWATR